jgi:hypothetical protein
MADDPSKEGKGEQASPREALRQGLSLIWQAARGAAGGLREEIRKADIPGGLREAAGEMRRAAEAAIHGRARDPEPQDVHYAQTRARIDTDVAEAPPPPPAEGASKGDDSSKG